ncbi:hypothetical protein MA16_Dca015306 [Dendrobium catenatum]|uniref:Uncharacterized protein n=1 Tax=Dendrobium catenatum TaxID=906689 RepID=A0A2I0X067_9ASPA|nr:hypothetical protein MA16_Dca015306 [Dendrobium catenatum]
MGNSLGCFSQRTIKRSKASRAGACNDFEHSDQLSLKALERLKIKSKSLNNHKVSRRTSSYSNHLSTKKIVPDSLVKERESSQREEVVRVKMVLTKNEVTELLTMLRRSHGDKSKQYLEQIDGTDRAGWMPSLYTIPEAENC